MTSPVRGLLCVFLVSGALGTFPPFGSHGRKIPPARPSASRGSPQASPRVYRRFGTASVQQTSEEVPGAEPLQGPGGHASRDFQQQEGTSSYLEQGGRRADSAGMLIS